MSKSSESAPPISPSSNDLQKLVRQLSDAESKLVAALGTSADAVIDSAGQAHLLRRAQEVLLSSERRYRTLIEQSTDMIALLDETGKLHYVSPPVTRILGFTQAELIERDGLDLFHPDDTNRALKVLKRIVPVPRASESITLRCRHRNGSYRWLESTITNLVSEPAVKAVVVICRDITDRTEADAARQKSERRFRTMFEGVEAGVIVHGPDMRITACNARATEILGVTAAQMDSRDPFDPLWSRVRVDGTPYAPEELPATRALATCQPVRNAILGYVHQFRGEFVWVLVNANPVLADGKVLEVIVTFMDVTAQIQAEQAVRDNASFTADVLNSLVAHVAVLDRQANIISVNEAWRRFARENGAGNCDFVGRNYLAVCREGAEEVAAGIAEVIKGERKHFTFEYPCHSPDEFRWFRMRATSLGGGRQGVVVSHHDITESKQSLEAMRVSERRFRALFEQAAVGVAQTDALTGRFVQVNQRLTEILGYTREELQQRTFVDVIHPDDVDISWTTADRLKAGTIRDIDCERRYRRKDGTEVWVNLTVSAMWSPGETPDHFIAVVQDITRRKQLEEQFRQSQKLEAIGQLSGGVAHDFNNILAVISCHAGLMKLSGSMTAENEESLQQIQAATERAANLTRQLLMFSRRQVTQLRRINLSQVVGDMAKMLRRMVGETVEIKLRLTADPLVILADSGMIDQILLNLAVNARDAMPRGGTLAISTEQIELNEGSRPPRCVLNPGIYSRLSIADTGVGIAPEVLPRIFEPFFTTKEVGKGTGLGLATVYGIVQQHAGWIDVISEPGHGARFDIYLPVAADSAPSADVSVTGEDLTAGRNETILVVEDESALRSIIEAVLVHNGYRVLSASNAVEAHQQWLAHGSAVDLLLTDVVMPGALTGKDLAAQLLGKNTALRVIYMSGYNQEFDAGDRAGGGGIFLNKPFDPSQLLRTIRNLLDRGPGPFPATTK